MRSSLRRLAVVVPLVGGACALVALPAGAAAQSVQASLQPVAGTDLAADGTATVTVSGNKVSVVMTASGLLADHPHAAHIHFGADARHECPTLADDTDRDGHLDTTEGEPAYGPVVISLTTTGDTSPASTLAVDRFSTAPGGELTYQRGSIKTQRSVAKAIADGLAVVVIHGVDHNHDGTYSGAKVSDLAPSLPTEATDPALCGALR